MEEPTLTAADRALEEVVDYALDRLTEPPLHDALSGVLRHGTLHIVRKLPAPWQDAELAVTVRHR